MIAPPTISWEHAEQLYLTVIDSDRTQGRQTKECSFIFGQ